MQVSLSIYATCVTVNRAKKLHIPRYKMKSKKLIKKKHEINKTRTFYTNCRVVCFCSFPLVDFNMGNGPPGMRALYNIFHFVNMLYIVFDW